jgi:antitoxin PrlF
MAASSTLSVLTSRLTRRSQTTIPKAVKNALQVGAGDDLGYVIEGNSVRLVNASAYEEHADPVVERFLALLADDIAAGNVHVLPAALLRRIQSLTEGVPVDHEEELTGAIPL